ncbi:hypothetical protein [Erythrobacter litoralis]|uniref:hypothetical protein n=1 Tax=Erythrobacter litoralis TaxID=39960 RepID=UPI0024347F03|nr:hypothetical protein [Erythrobacter litoralis]
MQSAISRIAVTNPWSREAEEGQDKSRPSIPITNSGTISSQSALTKSERLAV